MTAKLGLKLIFFGLRQYMHGFDQTYQLASTRPTIEKVFEDVSVSIHLPSKETSFKLIIEKKAILKINVSTLKKLIFSSSVYISNN